ncbi:Acyl-CoA N-acyltransferase [Metarhizium guizhouense ARSEF 977]|uniref:Acyl-CoA N-acyltransferase n=1 Tax=Metarhizium guizhouense (strain ARSEF 977) TaxID=1276136 RepID=A0A0B4GEN3_METGA|nr:Acyl-CoA N-acyltransferase [Metarhizium guizhouense ARSEF 977]
MSIRIRLAEKADIPAIIAVSMAACAFDPTTDAIRARLSPAHLQSTGGQSSKQWSMSRKSARLELRNSVIMVAVDDALGGGVVGYSM